MDGMRTRTPECFERAHKALMHRLDEEATGIRSLLANSVSL